MYYILYCSHALIPNTPEALNPILETSQRTNAAADITGFLHREAEFFLQHLEGEEAALRHFLSVISADPRHENVVVLAEGDLPKRHLPEWKMGFVLPGTMQLDDMLGQAANQLVVNTQDPVDLVVFMVSIAQMGDALEAA